MRCLSQALPGFIQAACLTLAFTGLVSCGGGTTEEPAPPASAVPVISYPSSPFTFFVGTAIPAITPVNAGAAASSWEISASLPAGLTFSAGSGQITGTPTATSAASTYTVTAMNAAGSGTASLSITVRTPDNSYGAVSASRTSGVAPLMVHFSTDYAGTPQGSLGFHNYDYAWDFGDPSSGVWGTNGKSKNAAKGAVAAHVFETAGTYVATLTMRGQNGVIGTESFTITVQDPEVVYAGNKTTCVNPAGDTNFTGAPAGSRQIATDDLSSITQYATVGSRILFKRGGSWTTAGLNNWPRNSGPVTLGAYGSGNNRDALGIYENAPQITVTSEAFLPLDKKEDWRITDLQMNDPNKTSGAFGGATDFQRMLMLRVKLVGFDTALGWSFWNDPNGDTQIDQIAIVSCDISKSKTMGLYIGSERLAMLGNNVWDIDLSHVVRIWQSYKGVISNNAISGSSLISDLGRQALKLHGPTEGEIASTTWGNLRERTEFTIVADNIFGGSGPWPVSIGPQNGQEDERLSNIVFERNLYCAQIGTISSLSIQPQDIYLFHASQVTIRNNLIDASGLGSDSFQGIWIKAGTAAPDSRDVWIYNNTVYKRGPAATIERIGITIDPGVQSAIARNNLFSFPGTSSGNRLIVDNGTGTIQSNNLLNNSMVFANPDGAVPLSRSFALTAESLCAIDAGFTLNSVFEDFAGNSRPAGAAWDIGAYEFR